MDFLLPVGALEVLTFESEFDSLSWCEWCETTSETLTTSDELNSRFDRFVKESFKESKEKPSC